MSISDPHGTRDLKRIPNQRDVENIADRIVDLDDIEEDAKFARRGTAVISATPAAISGTYVQAEVAALKTTIDEIKAALTASGVTS